MIFLLLWSMCYAGGPISWTPLEKLDLAFPVNMKISPDGRIFVVDSGNHRVHVLAADGSGVGGFGRKGQGPGEFERPAGLGFLSGGRILVSDEGNNRLHIFDAEGRFLKNIVIPNQSVNDLVVLPGDEIVLTKGVGRNFTIGEQKAPHRFSRWTEDGRLLGEFGSGLSHENPLLAAMLNKGNLGVWENKIFYAGMITNELIVYEGDKSRNAAYPAGFEAREPSAKMRREPQSDGSISFKLSVEADLLCKAIAVVAADELMMLRATSNGEDLDYIPLQLVRLRHDGTVLELIREELSAEVMAISPDRGRLFFLREGENFWDLGLMDL